MEITRGRIREQQRKQNTNKERGQTHSDVEKGLKKRTKKGRKGKENEAVTTAKGGDSTKKEKARDLGPQTRAVRNLM